MADPCILGAQVSRDMSDSQETKEGCMAANEVSFLKTMVSTCGKHKELRLLVTLFCKSLIFKMLSCIEYLMNDHDC